ncbi:MAG: hypothetical protein IJ317_01205 [Clostridia bacterium]|nr:hypothetical protein [Clostridia bacterium]
MNGKKRYISSVKKENIPARAFIKFVWHYQYNTNSQKNQEKTLKKIFSLKQKTTPPKSAVLLPIISFSTQPCPALFSFIQAKYPLQA